MPCYWWYCFAAITPHAAIVLITLPPRFSLFSRRFIYYADTLIAAITLRQRHAGTPPAAFHYYCCHYAIIDFRLIRYWDAAIMLPLLMFSLAFDAFFCFLLLLPFRCHYSLMPPLMPFSCLLRRFWAPFCYSLLLPLLFAADIRLLRHFHYAMPLLPMPPWYCHDAAMPLLCWYLRQPLLYADIDADTLCHYYLRWYYCRRIRRYSFHYCSFFHYWYCWLLPDMIRFAIFIFITPLRLWLLPLLSAFHYATLMLTFLHWCRCHCHYWGFACRW